MGRYHRIPWPTLEIIEEAIECNNFLCLDTASCYLKSELSLWRRWTPDAFYVWLICWHMPAVLRQKILWLVIYEDAPACPGVEFFFMLKQHQVLYAFKDVPLACFYAISAYNITLYTTPWSSSVFFMCSEYLKLFSKCTSFFTLIEM